MADIVIQRATDDTLPDEELIEHWAKTALAAIKADGEVTIRLVSGEEMQQLNNTYRGKDRLTNVLSFPVDEQIQAQHGLLGDIVICPFVVEHEAYEQGKPVDAHYAHLVIHGVLHLMGYDHIKDSDALIMESLETSTLATLGIDDPYIERATTTN